MGMIMAAYLAEELGLMQPEETSRIRSLWQSLNLPVQGPGYDAEAIYNGMLRTKSHSRPAALAFPPALAA